MPDATATPTSSIDASIVRLLTVCSHSRLGSRSFKLRPPCTMVGLRFRRSACSKYINPAAKPKSTVTVASRIEVP